MRDEIDNVSDNMISKIGKNQYRVDGKTTIYDFERFFHVELKDSEDSDVVTLSGYVLDNYHNIHEGETIKLADLDLKIQDIQGRDVHLRTGKQFLLRLPHQLFLFCSKF